MKFKGYLFCVCVFLPATLFGQFERVRPTAEAYLGLGVHQYFAGKYRLATESLTMSLGMNQRDPRAYFFRSLANQRLNRHSEAKSDLHAGAFWDAYQQRMYFAATNRALERIQGAPRIALEQYRSYWREKLKIARDFDLRVAPVGYGMVSPVDRIQSWLEQQKKSGRYEGSELETGRPMPVENEPQPQRPGPSED